MGNLTTLTIWNDDIDRIKENPEQFARELYNLIIEDKAKSANCAGVQIEVQKSRDAHYNTAYIQIGNSVFEPNPFSRKMRNLAKTKPGFYKEIVEYFSWITQELKKTYRENQRNP